MVEFTLPKNSRVTEGTLWPVPLGLLLHLLSGILVEPGPLSRPSLAPARLSLGERFARRGDGGAA